MENGVNCMERGMDGNARWSLGKVRIVQGIFCGGIEGGEGYGDIGIDRREMERANEKIDNE